MGVIILGDGDGFWLERTEAYDEDLELWEAMEREDGMVGLGVVGARAGNSVARDDKPWANAIISFVGDVVLRRLTWDDEIK